MDINAAGGSRAGVSDEKLAALPAFRTSPLYSEAERVALELAEAMTVGQPVDVSPELFARLRAHYDAPQLVELAATAALENFRARFNRVFDIEPNSLYCPIDGHAPTATSPGT
jgi:alkylhydroperoxidase family enzyme